MASPYAAKWGRRLDSLLVTLWGLSNHVWFPNRLLEAVAAGADIGEAERNLVSNQAMIQLVKRAYSTITYSDAMEMARNIAIRCAVFKISLQAGDSEEENVTANLRYLALGVDVQRRMSIWSSGPFLPLIPHGSATVIDIVAFTYVLSTLFYQVRDRDGEKGQVFEQELTTALIASGCQIAQSGRIRNARRAEREIDVAVRVGDKLFLLECVASERPLDFEIGNIETIETE
jgi:hypothetical protein